MKKSAEWFIVYIHREKLPYTPVKASCKVLEKGAGSPESGIDSGKSEKSLNHNICGFLHRRNSIYCDFRKLSSFFSLLFAKNVVQLFVNFFVTALVVKAKNRK
ncbi:MAG: hypothetical protein ACLU5C_01460 [Acutalibacter sp.]